MVESGERVERVAGDEGMGIQDIQDFKNLLDIGTCKTNSNHSKQI